jgi:hypothetical protein
VFDDAAHVERNMIKATEPILRNHEYRQLHLDGQIAHKIIGTNRHELAANPFDNHTLNPLLKCGEMRATDAIAAPRCVSCLCRCPLW